LKTIIKFVKKILQYLSKITGFWCSNDRILALKKYRVYELESVLSKIEDKKLTSKIVLDFGYGDGFQARYLKQKNFHVSAIDVDKKKMLNEEGINFVLYNGYEIPFEKKYFNIIFSSNVLEHLRNLDDIQQEFLRVLDDDGVCIHILPSSSWRFWTIVTTLIKYWYINPKPHGEITNNCFMELIYFSKFFWKKSFKKNNFKILKIFSNNLFYIGNNLFGLKLDLEKRILLSKLLGSSCNIFILKKNKND
jgi:SAM-dependent methyltransferase